MWFVCGPFIDEFISDVKIREEIKCSNYPRFDKDPDDYHYYFVDDPYLNNRNHGRRNEK